MITNNTHNRIEGGIGFVHVPNTPNSLHQSSNQNLFTIIDSCYENL